MKVFMIGGTGLLGSQGARELIERGHEVLSLARPPLSKKATFPEKMKFEFGNYLTMSDEELCKYLSNADAVVFASGIDERVEGVKPIYDLFVKHNNVPVERILRMAKKCGVKHSVILGSYFSYFAKTMPQLELERNHPYIRSRVEQEKIALSFADENFDVAVLELPYIFGTQPGRKPVWVFMVEMLEKMKKMPMWPKGGTTMVTVRQVGQAIAGAVERNKGGNCYPIGYYNMSWKEMLGCFYNSMGYENKKVHTIPTWMFKIACFSMKNKQTKKGVEGGLDLPKFAKLQASEQFIDKSLGCEKLGVGPDDIKSAIDDSVKLCLDIINKKETDIIEMSAK